MKKGDLNSLSDLLTPLITDQKIKVHILYKWAQFEVDESTISSLLYPYLSLTDPSKQNVYPFCILSDLDMTDILNRLSSFFYRMTSTKHLCIVHHDNDSMHQHTEKLLAICEQERWSVDHEIHDKNTIKYTIHLPLQRNQNDPKNNLFDELVEKIGRVYRSEYDLISPLQLQHDSIIQKIVNCRIELPFAIGNTSLPFKFNDKEYTTLFFACQQHIDRQKKKVSPLVSKFLKPIPIDQTHDHSVIIEHKKRLQKLAQFLQKAIEETYAAKFIYEEDIQKYIFKGIETLECYFKELCDLVCSIFRLPDDSISKNRKSFSPFSSFLGPTDKEKDHCLELYNRLRMAHLSYNFFKLNLPELDQINGSKRDQLIMLLHTYENELHTCYDQREELIQSYLNQISFDRFPSKKALNPIITSTYRDIISLIKNINKSKLLNETIPIEQDNLKKCLQLLEKTQDGLNQSIQEYDEWISSIAQNEASQQSEPLHGQLFQEIDRYDHSKWQIVFDLIYYQHLLMAFHSTNEERRQIVQTIQLCDNIKLELEQQSSKKVCEHHITVINTDSLQHNENEMDYDVMIADNIPIQTAFSKAVHSKESIGIYTKKNIEQIAPSLLHHFGYKPYRNTQENNSLSLTSICDFLNHILSYHSIDYKIVVENDPLDLPFLKITLDSKNAIRMIPWQHYICIHNSIRLQYPSDANHVLYIFDLDEWLTNEVDAVQSLHSKIQSL